MAMIVLSGEY